MIRNFGNFSAHQITDQTTLQVLAVDPGEAEWCLDILEEMFDHYYVKPAEAKARKAALDEKLAAAGKPRSKEILSNAPPSRDFFYNVSYRANWSGSFRTPIMRGFFDSARPAAAARQPAPDK